MKIDYQEGLIDPAELEEDPLLELGKWYDMAKASDDMLPEAVSLATVSPSGIPTVRIVLMRGFDARGIEFFTSYDSPKAADMDDNPNVSLAFHWKPLYRQIRIEGTATRVDKAESKAYWDTRPHGSRLAAIVSTQSASVDTWEEMADQVEELEKAYPEGSDVPLPDSWGGYRVNPTRFEFWLSRPSRLHDRFQYTQTDSGWAITRLQP
ncbi:TPA: pyridoxamine 5'-phosphate oxidase [Candidatus Latescibacteria bacterium]|nr:pyridoxamine 5'-phosphate oxidase [Candidatus Latescibacterota bacterium]|tara:strand:+ start:330 stop:953 length:624 start_codon:yes stop_codon:yes gene_type:complete